MLTAAAVALAGCGTDSNGSSSNNGGGSATIQVWEGWTGQEAKTYAHLVSEYEAQHPGQAVDTPAGDEQRGDLRHGVGQVNWEEVTDERGEAERRRLPVEHQGHPEPAVGVPQRQMAVMDLGPRQGGPRDHHLDLADVMWSSGRHGTARQQLLTVSELVKRLFPHMWQVHGLNLGRRSRRSYSPSLLPEADAADQHIRHSRHDRGLRPSAMRPSASGLVHGRGRKSPRTGPVGAVTPTVQPALCL